MDLADLIAGDDPVQLTMCRDRAPDLARWCARQPAGVWRSEAEVIEERNVRIRGLQGKVIWGREFRQGQAGLLKTGSTEVVRLARDGTISCTYEARLDEHRSADELIAMLGSHRDSARRRFRDTVLGLFPDARAVSDFLDDPSAATVPAASIEAESLDSSMFDYALIAVRHFKNARGREVPLDTVLRSPELAGIFNETPWFASYGDRHRELVESQALGYRHDELFLVGRKSTLIVCERIWSTGDSLHLYFEDLVVLVQHYLSCRAHLRQLLMATRSRLSVDQLAGRPAQRIAHDVLALRLSLMTVQLALDQHTMINQGFTRTLAERLRLELGIETSVRMVDDWLSTSEAIGLRESINAAEQSSALATRNNILQTTAVILAIVALGATVVIALFG
ncbi:hypothetical protein ACFQZZ_17080 [Nocardia sp. GCM10030253]|uniref:hypothetical protein n=1 Tax=Nocardia sp. GCM10030253 TaxID=3273404 RepID=UPI00362E76BF